MPGRHAASRFQRRDNAALDSGPCGRLLQTSNPKSLLFFLSVLPQVAEGVGAARQQVPLALAIGSYCMVLLVIHGVYAGLAARARNWLSQPRSARILSRLGALVFCAFGLTMLKV